MLGNLFNKFVNVLCEIAEEYLYKGRFDEITLLFDSIKEIMNTNEVKNEDKARFLIQFARIKILQKFLKEFNYITEIKMLQEALKLVEFSNFKKLEANALDLIGNSIYRKGILEGEFKESLEYYQKALNIRIQVGDKLGLSKSYFNLGLYHENVKGSNEKDKQKSFKDYKKDLKITEN